MRCVYAPSPQVVVVEQTETPELLAARNEQRRAQGLKKVRRCYSCSGPARRWRSN